MFPQEHWGPFLLDQGHVIPSSKQITPAHLRHTCSCKREFLEKLLR